MTNRLGKIVLVFAEDGFSLREIMAYCNDFLDPLSPGVKIGQEVANFRGVLRGENIRVVLSPVFGMDQDGARFQQLACFLNTIYAHGHRITGVIFARDSGPLSILPPRFSPAPSPDIVAIDILKAICGEDYYPQISIITTGWNRPPELDRLTHEARALVHPDRLLPLVSSGATLSRLQNSRNLTPQDTDAFIRILEDLLDNAPRALAFQEEISEQTRLKIHETVAGRIIHRRLHETHQRVEVQLRSLIPDSPFRSSQFPEPCMSTHIELEARIRDANDIIADRNLEVSTLQEDLATQSTLHATIVSELNSEIEQLREALNEAEIAAATRAEDHAAVVRAIREEAAAERAKAKQQQSALEVQLRDLESETSRTKLTQASATRLAEKELTEAKAEAKTAQLEKEKVQGDFDGLKAKVKESNANQKKILDQLKKELSEKQTETARLEAQTEKSKLEISKTTSELGAVKSSLEKSQATLQELKTLHAASESEYQVKIKQGQAQLDDEVRRNKVIQESHAREGEAQTARLESLEGWVSQLVKAGEENGELRNRVERLSQELEDSRERTRLEASTCKEAKEKLNLELRRMLEVEVGLEAQLRSEQAVHREEMNSLQRVLRETVTVAQQVEVPRIGISSSGWGRVYNGLTAMF